MKSKNTFMFTVACMVLAYNYAWSGYLLPSIVLSCVASLISYLHGDPSSEKRVHLSVLTLCVLLIELVVFGLVGYDSSTWIHMILAVSSTFSCGCWCAIYRASNREGKRMFEQFVIKSSGLLVVSFIITFVLFSYHPTLQFEILKFIVLMILPFTLTIVGYRITHELSVTYSTSKKQNA